jgi:hypothetical protein
VDQQRTTVIPALAPAGLRNAESSRIVRNRFACACLADELQEQISEQCAVPGANLASDLMGAALARVDWHEIAQEFLDDAREAE